MLEQTIEADKKSVEKVILILLLAYIIYYWNSSQLQPKKEDLEFMSSSVIIRYAPRHKTRGFQLCHGFGYFSMR